jgi:hypothetical protein
LAIHLGASYDALNFFSYFTNLSNLFASAVLLLAAFTSSSGGFAARDAVRFVSVANMTVVGLVFAVLLRDADLGALLPWINVVVHYVMPCAVLVDWLLQPPASRLKIGHLMLALVFPAVYLAYVTLRGASTGWYPYPFLNPAHVGGSSGVAAHAVGIAVTFLAAGWALLAIGNHRRAANAA